MKNVTFQARYSLLSLAVMAACAMPGAYAATLTVDPTAVDSDVAGDSKCSLREAVLSVNAGANVGDCVADITQAYGSSDTINLPAGTYTLTKFGLDETYTDAAPADPNTAPVVSNVPNAAIGDLDLTKSVKIVGAGSSTTTLQWDLTVADPDRFFHVFAATGTIIVEIQGVTFSKGVTKQVAIKTGPAGTGALPTTYYLRRAGGAVAVGPAAAVVLVDPNKTGAANANTGGQGGGSTGEESGATYTLALSGVVMDGNNAGGDGGGLYTAAATNMTSSILSNNIAVTNGGGIYNEGASSFVGSTISGNKAEGGGGLFLTGAAPVTISGTTLAGNRAIGGGAVSGRSGVALTMDNSTISGNLGDDVGGGFYSNGPATLRFVTIANNISGADASTAGSGINVYPSGAVNVSLKNVLLSGNRRGWDPLTPPPTATEAAALPSANCGYTGSAMAITSVGNNLSSDASCTTLIQSSDKASVDPKIDVLAMNSPGATQTHALLAGSPALGAGGAVAGLTVDQRGVTRDATPDIGAYEVPTAAVSSTPSTSSSSSSGLFGGCTSNPDAGFDPGLLAVLSAALGSLFLRRRRHGAVRR
jgi:hypothetical protein